MLCEILDEGVIYTCNKCGFKSKNYREWFNHCIDSKKRGFDCDKRRATLD